MESDLEAGKLDLGISFIPPGRKSLTGEKLFTEELVAVVASDHEFASRHQLRVRDLASQPLALLSQKYCTRQLIDDAFAAAGVEPEVRVEMNTVASILSTIRRMQLASLLPSLAMCKQEEGLKAIAVTHPTPRRAIGLIWLKGTNRRTAAAAFARGTEAVLTERKLNGP